MKESEAFYLLAEAYSAHDFDELATGLCGLIVRLRIRGVIPRALESRMRERIARALVSVGIDSYSYAYPGYLVAGWFEAHREARVLAALWFALECEEEGA